MSVVHNNLRQDTTRPRMWYLKLIDGSTYGPVELSILYDWAAQGRIAPTNEVSSDGRHWRSAQDVEELKMEWMALLASGKRIGPFNILAVPNLVRSNVLPADIQLANRLTGRKIDAHELLSPRNSTHPTSLEALQAPAPESPYEIDPEEPPDHLLHAAQTELAIEHQTHPAPTDDDLDPTTDEEWEQMSFSDEPLAFEDETLTKEQRLKEGIADLHQRANDAWDKFEKARREIARQKARNKKLEERMAHMENKYRGRLIKIKDDMTTLDHEFEALKRALTASEQARRQLEKKLQNTTHTPKKESEQPQRKAPAT